jgi:hypothetical protein
VADRGIASVTAIGGGSVSSVTGRGRANDRRTSIASRAVVAATADHDIPP